MNEGVEIILNKAQVARFHAKVKKRGELECWDWQAARSKTGYGLFNVSGVMRLAHRVAYVVYKGAFPEYFCVCHSCDNPRCCNPAHLWLGTQSQNHRDMCSKKREPRGESHGLVKAPWKAAHGDRNGSRKYIERMPRGEANAAAKLNASSVREIRAMSESGRFKTNEIAEKYGVSRANVIAIHKRKTWKHLP